MTEPADLDTGIKPLDWSALLAADPEPVRWLIPHLIAEGRSYALASTAKAGKSLLTLEQCARHGVRTLYLDAEQTRVDLRGRIAAMGMTVAELAAIDYLLYPPIAPLDTVAGGEQLMTLVDQYQPELVVLDTVSRFVRGDENESGTYQALYRNSLLPLKRAGVSSLRLDHLGKDAAKGQRGSSAKNDDVDAVWVLVERTASQLFTLRCERQRSGDHPQYIDVTRETGPLRHELAPGGVQLIEQSPILAIVADLDRHEIPVTWGRDRVRRAYRGRCSTATLAEAIRLRRERSDDPQKPVRDAQDRSAGQVHQKPVRDAQDRSDITAGQTCSGQVADRSTSPYPETCPSKSVPIGTDRSPRAGQQRAEKANFPTCSTCHRRVAAHGISRCAGCESDDRDLTKETTR